MRIIKSILIIVLMQIFMLTAQDMVRWEINLHAPEKTKDDAPIYIAGNFNGWDPGNTKYELRRNDQGIWTGEFILPVGRVEFKFTLGSWGQVEVDPEGNDIENRVEILAGQSYEKSYEISAWRTNVEHKNIVGNVQVIEDVDIPQLNRTRRIWIYLPPDYDKGLKRYPVLYMHDGQNLFADSTSFSGEWGIDETLERMIAEKSIPPVIVVGIDNSPYRLSEYSPFDFEYGGGHKGEAQQYGKFIVETLKPYIDMHYRTKRGRKYTAIAGSSMGGLVSVYIALEHQDVFSKVGALSSSFGVCRADLITYIRKTPKEYSIRFWLDLGSLEDEEMEYDVNQVPVIESLIDAGWEEELKFTLYEGAKHHERYWRERFDDVLLYLFK